MGPLSFPLVDHVVTKEPFLSNFTSFTFMQMYVYLNKGTYIGKTRHTS